MAAVEAAGSPAVKADAAAAVIIRKCEGFDELQACVRIQEEVWGYDPTDIIPVRMFIVAQKVGGQTLGAFLGSEMVGFLLAIPGARSGRSYLHSHMLAVREDMRNSGLGRRMKLAQRDDALARGFDLVEWTFDPLEIKNAWLNLERLGAIARRYTVNQYGITASPLQGGLPSDRLTAEWWLRSRRVTALLDDERPRPSFAAEQVIDVPAEIYRWKASPPTRARAAEVQSRNRDAFQSGFGQGLAALGYERDVQGNGRFLLGKWDEDWSL